MILVRNANKLLLLLLSLFLCERCDWYGLSQRCIKSLGNFYALHPNENWQKIVIFLCVSVYLLCAWAFGCASLVFTHIMYIIYFDIKVCREVYFI